MNTVQHKATISAEQSGQRLDQALAELFPDYSRSRIKDWILAGNVLLDGAAPAPRTRVAEGQEVEMTAVFEAQVADAAEPLALDVVFEDEDLLVINKPAGLVVHPGAGNRAGTLVNGLLHHCPALEKLPRGGLLHRLDKDTSGLLLVAKSVAAHTQLTRALQEREITREYRAVCTGRVTAGGSVDAPLGRHPTQRTRMAVTERGKAAVTHYRVLRRFEVHSFLALRLESGRTHQIRVHMAHIRHPLVGDRVYGGRMKMPAGVSPELAEALRGFRRQALHAARLGFAHPAGHGELEFSAPLPDDMVHLLCALDGQALGAEEFDAMSWPTPSP